METRLFLFVSLLAASVKGDGDVTNVLQLREATRLSAVLAGEADAHAEENALEKEWMSNVNGLGAGVMRMVGNAGATDEDAPMIWIPSIGRSGSTVTLDLITHPVTFEERSPSEGSQKFVLFEPCHAGDNINGTNVTDNGADSHEQNVSCSAVVKDISSCDFSRINTLWGWTHSHHSNHPENYTKQVAGQACSRASLVAFKTVSLQFWDSEHALRDRVLPVLEQVPRLKAVVNVRDPRAIYASWKNHVFWTKDDVSLIPRFCRFYAGVTEVQHPRLFFVRFEDLVTLPALKLREIYGFLGFRVGPKQELWVKKHFVERNDENCTETNPWNHDFSTCRPNVRRVIDSWKFTLTQEEKNAFTGDPLCRQVAQNFLYPPS